MKFNCKKNNLLLIFANGKLLKIPKWGEGANFNFETKTVRSQKRSLDSYFSANK
jgi:hypothetical protein